MAGIERTNLLSPIPTLQVFKSGREDANAHTLLFVHGWPDDERVFTSSYLHFERHYRIASVRLPWFGNYAQASSDAARLGYTSTYSLQVLAEALARTAHTLGPSSKLTVVGHDWGAFISQMTEYKYPGIFHSMISIDVALTSWSVTDKVWHMGTMVPMAAVGAIYMWHNSFCCFLYRLFPSAARKLANWKVRSMLTFLPIRANANDSTNFKRPSDYPSHGDIHPLSGYVYHDFHRMYWLRLFGLAPKLVERPPSNDTSKESSFPTCPIFFVYGNSGPDFHSKSWEKSISRRNDGSKVSVFEGIGHWVMLEESQRLNTEMEQWLAEILNHSAPQ